MAGTRRGTPGAERGRHSRVQGGNQRAGAGASAKPGTGRQSEPGGRPAATRAREREPDIPTWADAATLDPSVRSALRPLSGRVAAEVAGHLAAAAELLADDPRQALAHARAARSRAARIAVVREATGICAYRAQEWHEARTELRAAHRMSAANDLLPMLVDTERALGRPAEALRLAGSVPLARLDDATRIELVIVIAALRRELGAPEVALAVLEREDVGRRREPEQALRLAYAYADLLTALGRTAEATQWFARAAALDTAGVTDAAERVTQLL